MYIIATLIDVKWLFYGTIINTIPGKPLVPGPLYSLSNYQILSGFPPQTIIHFNQSLTNDSNYLAPYPIFLENPNPGKIQPFDCSLPILVC